MSKKRKENVFKKFLSFCIVLGLFMALVAVCIVGFVIVKTEPVDISNIQDLKLTSYIYDKDGNEMSDLYQENRVEVKYEQLPKYYVDAVISIEDTRYFSHCGIDFKRTASAILSFVKNRGKSVVGGGSTITQQLVKNVTGDDEVNYTRKIREWYRAIALEQTWTKEQIFESYVNTIYLGAGSYGVEVAAQTYFSKSIEDVTLEEAACLAALIQLPEGYNPYRSEEAKEKLLARKDLVLDQMVKYNRITQAECDEAKAKEVAFSNANKNKVNSYFVDAVIEQVIVDLMDKRNVSRETAINMIYSNGYKIYSTQDTEIQNILEEEYANTDIFGEGENSLQSAMVINDYRTGDVVALVGGVTGTKQGVLELNRATRTYRQPGSSLKPLAAYGPAFEKGIIMPSSIITDEKTTFEIPGSEDWTPKNWYNGFKGDVTIKYALEQSMNIPAAKLVDRVGTEYSYDFLKGLGFKKLEEADKNSIAALSLGGLTNGVSTYEMAAAYGAIANNGIYVMPKLYTKVVDRNGYEVLSVDTKKTKVMEETTSYLLIDTLKSVVTNGLGKTAKISNMTVGGKTGTTTDSKDKWFCGFTPYYSAATWIGYDTPKEIDNSATAIVVWKNVMKRVHENLPNKDFKMPKDLISIEVCSETGLLPTSACNTVTQLFTVENAPKERCSHKYIEICEETGLLANPFCTLRKKILVTDETDITEVCKKHTEKHIVTICNETGDLATEFCPDITQMEFAPGEEPTQFCNIHTSDRVTVTVCAETGLLPNENCTTVEREFAPQDVPTAICSHKYVKICQESGLLANDNCPIVIEKLVTDDEILEEICNIHKGE